MVYHTTGPNAALINAQTGKTIRKLSRGDHYLNTGFPIAFFVHEGSTFLIAASDWNRLDIYEPSTGRLLTERSPTSYVNDQRPPHYLDYCHGSLSVSPQHEFVVDDGWVWHPVGILRSWNLSAWLSNVWESEDGPTVKELAQRDYFWNGPVCWIHNTTLAFWGWGRDDDWLVPAAVLVDARDGQMLQWFPGPDVRKSRRHSDSSFFFDRHLFAVDDDGGTTVWDINTGECLLTDKDVKPWRYHPDSKEFLEITPTGFRLSTLVG